MEESVLPPRNPQVSQGRGSGLGSVPRSAQHQTSLARSPARSPAHSLMPLCSPYPHDQSSGFVLTSSQMEKEEETTRELLLPNWQGSGSHGLTIAQRDDGVFVQEVMQNSPAARTGVVKEGESPQDNGWAWGQG